MRPVLASILPGGPFAAANRRAARAALHRLIQEGTPVRRSRGEAAPSAGRLVRRVDDPRLGDDVGVLRTSSGADVYADVRHLASLATPTVARPARVGTH